MRCGSREGYPNCPHCRLLRLATPSILTHYRLKRIKFNSGGHLSHAHTVVTHTKAIGQISRKRSTNPYGGNPHEGSVSLPLKLDGARV
ncbi:hypothetical protein V6N11_082147 [Hibiscus sabdariffa]|uniref:Uncharacterized protein n=1 Tax=Hibiscus sabdariffa TaxID=183260 RepID=A0ABR2QH44_9ROSI